MRNLGPEVALHNMAAHVAEPRLDPAGDRRPQTARRELAAKAVRQKSHDVRMVGEVIERKGAYAVFRPRQTTQHVFHGGGRVPRRTFRADPANRLTREEIDVSADLAQQRRRFAAALPGPDDRDAISGERREILVLAAVADQLAQEVRRTPRRSQ